MKSLNLQFKYLEYCVFNVLILHILYVKLQASGESGENSHLYRAFGVLSSGRRKDYSLGFVPCAKSARGCFTHNN